MVHRFLPVALSLVLVVLLWGARGPRSRCAVGGHQGRRWAGFSSLLCRCCPWDGWTVVWMLCVEETTLVWDLQHQLSYPLWTGRVGKRAVVTLRWQFLPSSTYLCWIYSLSLDVHSTFRPAQKQLLLQHCIKRNFAFKRDCSLMCPDLSFQGTPGVSSSARWSLVPGPRCLGPNSEAAAAFPPGCARPPAQEPDLWKKKKKKKETDVSKSL